MLIDARQLNNYSIIKGDLCIVGAGPAGLSIALDWIGSGKKIILLVGGGFDFDQELQSFYEGKNLGRKYYDLRATRLHAFGGTTGFWGGFCSPFDLIDFEKRPWVPNSGWPIKLDDLKPYFKRCAEIYDLNSGEFSGDTLSHDEDNASICNTKFGTEDKFWQFSPPTRLGAKYRETVINSNEIYLYTYAHATEIEIGENGEWVKQVKVQNFEGKEHYVNCNHYIVAAGALQNTKLLFASNKVYKNGIGNEFDQLGRYFMDHLEIDSGDLFLKENSPLMRYMRNGVKTKTRAEISITPLFQEKNQILNGTVSLKPITESEFNKNFVERFNNVDPKKKIIKRSLIQRVENKIDKLVKKAQYYDVAGFNLYTRLEQAPNPESRLITDSEKDAFGVQKINLNWNLSHHEKRSLRIIHEIIATSLGIDDKGRLRLMEFLWNEADLNWPDFLIPGMHHMGTTRMNDDRDCKEFCVFL